MSSTQASFSSQDSTPSLTLPLLWRALVKARPIALVIIGFFIFFALMYVALLRTPQYRAQATIGPVPGTSGSGGTTQAFAAYAGVDIGSADTGRFSKYLQVLHSFRLAQRLEDRHHVLGYLIPGWDEKTHRWNPPSGVVSTVSRFVKGLFGAPTWQPPDAGTLDAILSKQMRIERVAGATILDTKNQISTVTLELKDRTLAVSVLGWIIDEADGIVREDQFLNTTGRIDYLSAGLRKAPEVFLADSLQRILLDQERVLMTLKADRRYSVDLIDPPNAGRRAIGLSSIAVIFISAVLALMLYVAIVVVLLRSRLSRLSGDQQQVLAEPFPDPIAWMKARFTRKHILQSI